MTQATTDQGFELLKLEYESCWARIGQAIDAIEKTEIYALGAIAAIFAYATGTGGKGEVLFLCPIIALLGWLRYEGFNSAIEHNYLYVRYIESRYSEIGLSTFRSDNRTTRYIVWVRRFVWATALIVSTYYTAHTLP